MVEGPSGILAVSPPWNKPEYNPSKRRLTWKSGAKATLLSAERPDRLRGPQCEAFWCDELAAFRYPEAWTQLMMSFRLSKNPKGIVTTTPRPTPIVKSLIKRDGTDVVVTRGTTYENRANLAPAFYESIIREYENTRLGRQELLGEVLDDNPGALWQREWLDNARVKEAPQLSRVVIAVDPAVSTNADSCETGIVAVGRTHEGHAFVLEDKSGIYDPLQWAGHVAQMYHWWKADRVVAEVNNGGDLVEANLRTVAPNIPFRAVHASRGKAVRAEPVSALYEQGRVHHVGMFAKLEDQMCEWDPAMPGVASPDRVDALVWALTDLLLGVEYGPRVQIERFDRESSFDSGGW
jgi:phage terminase large subunit-like protein